MTLVAILLLAVGTYAIRLVGPLLKDRIDFSPTWERAFAIAAVTLLGAFVATSTLLESGEFAGPARLAGVLVGGVLAWRRAPFLMVVLAAAGVTASLRLLGAS